MFPATRTGVNPYAATIAAYMSGVYTWMIAGIVVTGIFAMLCANSADIMTALTENVWPFIVLFIAQIGLVIWLSAGIHKMSPQTATLVFLLYSALTGVTFSTLFLVYDLGNIASAFFATAGSFAGLAIYGSVTKRDLSSLGTFCFMGLIGIIIASIVNLFVQNSAMGQIIAYVGVLVFAGLTAYDVQKLRAFGEDMPSGDAAAVRRGTILGALTLYLDFINLFLFLLRIMGGNRD